MILVSILITDLSDYEVFEDDNVSGDGDGSGAGSGSGTLLGTGTGAGVACLGDGSGLGTCYLLAGPGNPRSGAGDCIGGRRGFGHGTGHWWDR